MPIGDIFVEKCKATQFFTASSLPKIREVVSIVHDITSTATLFIKHFYLNVVYNDWLSDDGQLPARDAFKLDAAFIEKVFSLVKRASIQHRGDGAEQPVMMDRLTRLYRSTAYFAGDFISNGERYGKHSLSHAMAYSAQQLETAYTNNIVQHSAASRPRPTKLATSRPTSSASSCLASAIWRCRCARWTTTPRCQSTSGGPAIVVRTTPSSTSSSAALRT